MVQHIKSSEEMEVTYMKSEERERLIREEGRVEGREEGKMQTYLELVLDGVLSLEEAARRLQMTEEDLKKQMQS